MVSSGLAPEKLTIKFPKLVSKANKVRFALASESKAIKDIKTTDFMLDEVVVTAKRISKGEKVLEGSGKAGIEWSFRNIPEGGATITGRKYSEHALERMAPNTPEIRAELRTKADKIAGEKGLVPGSKEYNEFINKYVDPRGITPTVVEDAIRNTKPAPGNTTGTFVHENANVRVIVNSNGDVITVIPR